MDKIHWKQKDGTLIAVDEMTEAHVKNVLKMLIRNNMIGKKQVVRDDKWDYFYWDHLEQMEEERDPLHERCWL